MSDKLFSVIYTSRALVPALSRDAASIYLEARHKNAELGITGMLHREGEHYVQCLEGSERVMDKLVRRISMDWRHTDFKIRKRQQIYCRSFTGWSMAFTDEKINQLRAILGNHLTMGLHQISDSVLEHFVATSAVTLDLDPQRSS